MRLRLACQLTACLKRSNSAQCSSCRLLNNARRGLCRATASLCALPCPSRRITCCPDARKQMDEATEAKRPVLSIIIPTLNEAHSIGATLDALLAVRGHIELIVVDGGSHDGTIEILRARGVRVIESEQGRGVQMHAGVDRKSTRLNSSHSQISYAVFCLKKKKKKQK